MAVTLRRLLEYVKDEELQILSGEDNIDRVVRWTHVVEAIEISTFLEGQEVAFTTGVATKSEEELFDLVKCIIDNQATALIINTGPYIKEVPQKIIDYCKEQSFPLITTPWETHMAKLMQMFYFQKQFQIVRAQHEEASHHSSYVLVRPRNLQ